MQINRQLDPLFTSINDNLFIPAEYICLPNFLAIANDVVTESPNCTLFNLRKLYGWDSFSGSYTLRLFDAGVNPTVGVWQNDCLTIYQDVPVGYLRLSYLVKKSKASVLSAEANDCLNYSFLVDISSDGIQWHRYSRGEYRSC